MRCLSYRRVQPIFAGRNDCAFRQRAYLSVARAGNAVCFQTILNTGGNNYGKLFQDHPAKNICAIFDSNGRFEKLWQFSAYLVQKGFKIVEVSADDKFLDGNIPKAPAGDQLILRACAKGQPVINGDSVEVSGKHYTPDSEA